MVRDVRRAFSATRRLALRWTGGFIATLRNRVRPSNERFCLALGVSTIGLVVIAQTAKEVSQRDHLMQFTVDKCASKWRSAALPTLNQDAAKSEAAYLAPLNAEQRKAVEHGVLTRSA